MRVIPAIDLIDGRPVRLSEGDYSRRREYSMTALDAAKRFEDGGLKYLHLVDLDAARGSGSNLPVLEQIAAATSLEVDFGGGIRSLGAVRSAFSAGAWRVNAGSAAVHHPEEVIRWNEEYPGRIILSADARDGMIAVSGWQEATDEPLIPFIRRFIGRGITSAAVTDISRDGMLSGPALELYAEIVNSLPELELIASGGVSCGKDLADLARIGVYGAIVGKAYYEGRISIDEMREAECWQKG